MYIYFSLPFISTIFLSLYLCISLYYVVAYLMLRLCFSFGLLLALLFIFLLPFRASDCVHNFLSIFIVCLVVYFAVHNLCLDSSTRLSPPLSLSSRSCLFVLCRFPNSTPAWSFSSSSYALLSSLWRRHFLRFLRLSSVSTLGSGPGARVLALLVPGPGPSARRKCITFEMFVKWRP